MAERPRSRISITEMVAVVGIERARREREYPKWVERKRMSQSEFERTMRVLAAVEKTLLLIGENEDEIRALLQAKAEGRRGCGRTDGAGSERIDVDGRPGGGADPALG